VFCDRRNVSGNGVRCDGWAGVGGALQRRDLTGIVVWVKCYKNRRGEDGVYVVICGAVFDNRCGGGVLLPHIGGG